MRPRLSWFKMFCCLAQIPPNGCSWPEGLPISFPRSPMLKFTWLVTWWFGTAEPSVSPSTAPYSYFTYSGRFLSTSQHILKNKTVSLKRVGKKILHSEQYTMCVFQEAKAVLWYSGENVDPVPEGRWGPPFRISFPFLAILLRGQDTVPASLLTSLCV